MRKIIVALLFFLFFFTAVYVKALDCGTRTDCGTWKDHDTISFQNTNYIRRTIDGKTSYIKSGDVQDLCVAENNNGSSNANKYAPIYADQNKNIIHLIRDIDETKIQKDTKANYIEYKINLHLGNRILKDTETDVRGGTLFTGNGQYKASYGCDEVKNSKLPIDLFNAQAADDTYRWLNSEFIQSTNGKRDYQKVADGRFVWADDKNSCKEFIRYDGADKSKGVLSHNGKRNGADVCDYEHRDIQLALSNENSLKPPTENLPDNVETGADTKAILEELANQKCGGEKQVCCSTNFRLPNPKLQVPKFGHGLGTVINVLLKPITIFVSPIWRLLGNVTGGIWHAVWTNPPCKDGLKSLMGDNNSCSCVPKDTFSISKLCEPLIRDDRNKNPLYNPVEHQKCLDCNSHGIWTAIGCVDFSPEKFIGEKVFGLGVGAAGIFSLLCIIYSAFLLQTSRGDPERIKKAREYITNCIMGLIMVIFSILILKVIGVNILNIPGFK